jgi:hypothetical protein
MEWCSKNDRLLLDLLCERLLNIFAEWTRPLRLHKYVNMYHMSTLLYQRYLIDHRYLFCTRCNLQHYSLSTITLVSTTKTTRSISALRLIALPC